MNSEGKDVDWATGRVIGGVVDALKVHAGHDVLNYRCVVIDLTNPLW
jgi:hypothetical protein